MKAVGIHFICLTEDSQLIFSRKFAKAIVYYHQNSDLSVH